VASDTEQASSRPIALQRPDAGTHLPVLDGVRGVAIILVLLLHFTLYGELTPTLSVEWVYYKIMTAGWIGVDLFFVLSGFLITGILYDSKGGEHYFRNFYIRRVLRIFPLYYGSLVLFFLILPNVFPSDQGLRALRQDAAWYWTYLSNVLVARDGWSAFGPMEHFWSLAVEEQFYLMWPLAVFLLSRRGLMAACLACFIGSLLTRVGLELRGHEIAAHVLTPARMDALAVGALLALVARGPNGLRDLARWARPALAVTSACLLGVFAWRRGLPSEDVVVSTIGYSLLAVLFGATLVLGLTSSPQASISKVLTAPALMLFGRYSYALYVFHHPVLTMLKRRTTWLDTMPPLLGSRLLAQVLFTVVGITIVLGIASLSWHLYEKQFLKLKRLFPYPRGAPGVAVSAPLETIDQARIQSPAIPQALASATVPRADPESR
jgi:peptidoglycan/LPS O-acetylase OafA/YrhL